MRKLEIELVGFGGYSSCVSIDGKYAKSVKGKSNTYIVETEKETCQLAIYKSHFYAGKAWFWCNLFFFIISVFGLFDIRHNKNCLVMDVKFNISTAIDGKVVVKKEEFVDGGKVCVIEADTAVEEVSNVSYYDKQAQKRQKTMKKFKIAATILSLVLTVLLVALL